MKTFRMLSVLALMVSGWITSLGQTIEAEVPGDHFSLEGALELFKKSSSPEEFEKMLNSPDSKVNNLDLNGDGYIDYIRVHDRYQGDVHAFILQAVVSENELQDIAVVELERLSNGKAVLQIIGDEDIYGVTTIIEPTKEVRTYAGAQTSRTVVNVWAWPSVQYVYGPHYRGWVSPWGWYHRPVWWSRWRPIAYVHYHPIWRPYHRHYVVCHSRRIVHAHDIYRPYRRSSVIVHHRHRDRVVRYRETYSDGHRRNDGRTYVRDDRSRTRNSYQRTSDVQRRNDEATRGRSGVQREATSSDVRNRSTLERSANTPRQREMERSRSTTTPASQSNIRKETPRRTEMDRIAPVIRSPEVNQRGEVPPSARPSTPQRSREVPQETRPSSRERSSAPQIQRSSRPSGSSRSEAVRGRQ